VLESVSRLDKPTSGVLIVPLSRAVADFLTGQFKSRSVEKTYLCLCSGVAPTTGQFDAKLRTLSRGRGSKTAPHPQGKEALTEYRRLAVYQSREQTAEPAEPARFSLCEVSPRTGRTHQIRAHFAHGGHPLAGDVKYGGATVGGCTEDRLFLHSARLRFAGVGGDQHDVSAELPPELTAVLDGLVKLDDE
jgi:23S rRNA-/tRNA-specific pseudouridylate synthase